MNLERYTINSIHEETYCERCGYPLLTGDPALMDAEGAVFCSHTCAKEKAKEIMEINRAIREYDSRQMAVYETEGL
jgi:hypothetical protein